VSNTPVENRMKALAIGVLLLLSAATVSAQVTPAQQAREELALGVQAYKSANYDEAVEHFQRAVLLNDDLCVAKLYLATAYAQQYVPGVEARDNVAMANHAIDQYRATLKCDPRNVNPLKGIAFLNMQLKKFEEAKQGYREALKLAATDPELYYSIGVIDWTEAYKKTTETKTRYSPLQHEADTKNADTKNDETAGGDDSADGDDDTGGEESPQAGSESPILPDDLLNLSPACPELRSRNLPLVEDGIKMLSRATELRKNYDDAMAYMNLLYRQRAEIECGDRAGSVADIKKADDWSDLAMATRKKKAEAEEKCVKADNPAACAK